MPFQAQIVLSTCPDQATAEKIAGQLLSSKLIACANIIPGISSMFYWNNQITTENEVLLIIKTTADHYDQVENIICREHPYELPEVIAVSVEQGLAAYLDWIKKSTTE